MNEITTGGAAEEEEREEEAREDEDPAALIREVTALEREIQDGLEKLLADVESTT